MAQSLLNYDEFRLQIYQLCVDRLDEQQLCEYEDILDEYVDSTTNSLFSDFKKYVHKSDKSIYANLAQIDINWDGQEMNSNEFLKYCHFDRFDDLVKAADENKLNEDQLKEAQNWCLEWFWFAFGTWGITYNFDSLISEIEYENARENFDYMS